MTVALLLKLGKVFGVDLQELSDDAERRLAAALREVFADAGLGAGRARTPRRSAGWSRRRPRPARAIVELYRAWRTAREDAQALQLDLPGGRTRRVVLPTEEARDFFEDRANHFPEIEAAAEALACRRMRRPGLGRALAERLARTARHRASTIAPLERMDGALAALRPAARALLTLSEVLPRSSRHFHLAYQLGLLEAREAIDARDHARPSCPRPKPRRCAASASPITSPARC